MQTDSRGVVVDVAGEIKCMDVGCSAVLADDFIAALASPALQTKLARFAVAEFIEENPLVKKCRNPACAMSIRLCYIGERDEVVCDEALGGCGA
jgi:hypothetical protein